MLHCTPYKEHRSQSIHLQQPYLEESDQNTVDSYLINKTLRKRKTCYLPYRKEDNMK